MISLVSPFSAEEKRYQIALRGVGYGVPYAAHDTLRRDVSVEHVGAAKHIIKAF